ncbi:MAG: phosphoribosylaminoimidazolesuccinocarboxamide synthase [Acidobacteria bacterium]|nr:phosphoribosylaminoimidazolesuccinocarboxamide synthase [Acidobacteriota bacterium]
MDATARRPLLTTELPGVELRHRGKVRDVYDLGDQLLIVATDRVSAFDVVLPTGIANKGTMLTQLSSFWFERVEHIVGNHLISTEPTDYPDPLPQFADQLHGRSQYVHKADRFDVECVVRGYLIGSGWKDYQATGAVCGIPLPDGLQQADRLPELIFTPATKADEGHDENISFEVMTEIVGADWAEQLRDVSLQLYSEAAEFALERGIIIADTKFEFGLVDGKLTLIDEILTPDSSRFWPADQYAPGQSPPSYDKQFVRDYLQTLVWAKNPPGPELPADIIERTSAKYAEAYQVLTGQPLPDFS